MDPLGGLLALFWLAWEACWPKTGVKNNTKHIFSKTNVFAILVVTDKFWGPPLLILGGFWPLNGTENEATNCPTSD